MKVTFLSDLHGQALNLRLEKTDLLILCGDLTPSGTIKQLYLFNQWLEDQSKNFDKCIGTVGNHCSCFEDYEDASREVLNMCEILIDQETTYKGLRIYGSPWQPEFNNWHFNLPRGKALREKWDKIPSGLDILITHGPPMGILDQVEGHSEHLGCEELYDVVCNKLVKGPLVHAFGHIHSPGGQIYKTDKTIFVNAAVCNEKYQPLNKIVTLDI